MLKTSVYLPAELKARLAQGAARSGLSEAAFIRRALETALQGGRGPRTVATESRALSGPLLIGVGVGPGASDLLTGRALQAIRQADTVFTTAISPEAIGRAEATVRAALGPIDVVRLPVDVRADRQAHAEALTTLVQPVVEHLDRGEVVAFLTIGDPNMFSVFARVSAAVRDLRPDLPTMTVPGIMAFQELAARSGTVVGDQDQSVRIVAGGADDTRIADALQRANETLVLYRGGRSIPAIARQLSSARRATGTVVGELLGLPGERCASVEEFFDRPASYLASMIAPAPGA